MTLSRDDLRAQIAASSDAATADELIDAYEELKRRYLDGDYRPGQLEGGRFAEAAFRVLQHMATGQHTPVGRALPDVPTLQRTLAGSDPATTHESVRIHIPRALAVVYDVRNRRDVGHIAADVDANVMDAEMVTAVCSWVLAELVRLVHACTPEEAQAYADAIVQRPVPLVEMFGGRPLVLDGRLSLRDEILILLYHRGELGAAASELSGWIPGSSRNTVSARLSELARSRLVAKLGTTFALTREGSGAVDRLIAARGGT